MESANHACKLKCFNPRQQPPFMLLESLAHLRERGHLGPRWLALEQKIASAFLASETNKGWAWQLNPADASTTPGLLFDAWKFNLHSGETLEAKKAMLPQLELAEDELIKIVASLDPPSEEMLKEMDVVIEAIKAKVRAKVNQLLDELLS